MWLIRTLGKFFPVEVLHLKNFYINVINLWIRLILNEIEITLKQISPSYC